MKIRKFIAAGLCSFFGSIGSALTADAIVPGPNTVEYTTASGWTFTVAPYGWFAGLEGDVGARGRTTHVDQSIGDILDKFDVGLMGVAEARYDRVGVFTDLVYVRLWTPAIRRLAFWLAASTSL